MILLVCAVVVAPIFRSLLLLLNWEAVPCIFTSMIPASCLALFTILEMACWLVLIKYAIMQAVTGHKSVNVT